VVLYSHGCGDWRSTITETAENLASRGYVFVSMDHYDAWGTVFPDGTYLHKNTSACADTAGLANRVADFRCVVDALQAWNESDALFTGCFNLTNLAAMGFSSGTDTASAFASTNDCCRAAILMDTGGYTSPPTPRKPFLEACNWSNADKSRFNAATKDAVWFQLSNSVHLDFNGWSWGTSGIAAGREADRTLNAATLSFLNKYLKGVDDGSLARLPVDYPRIVGFVRK